MTAQLRIPRLEVRSVNTGAQDLYQKLGFAVTQRLPRYYSNGGDGLMMRSAASIQPARLAREIGQRLSPAGAVARASAACSSSRRSPSRSSCSSARGCW